MWPCGSLVVGQRSWDGDARSRERARFNRIMRGRGREGEGSEGRIGQGRAGQTWIMNEKSRATAGIMPKARVMTGKAMAAPPSLVAPASMDPKVMVMLIYQRGICEGGGAIRSDRLRRSDGVLRRTRWSGDEAHLPDKRRFCR